MKKLLNLLVLLPLSLMAQIDLPPASPDASWTHQLGFTQIEMSYSRPQMRGRKIFGSLVPYNQLWRTGAGESSRITFSEDIYFGGELVKKGKYAIYSIPSPREWTIILNNDATLHGDFGYDEAKDALRIKVKPVKSETKSESFTIDLVDFQTDYSASLRINWENTSVFIPVKSMADQKVMDQIQNTLVTQKSENAGLLHKGAQYYLAQKKDLNQALEWSLRSEALAPNVFNHMYLTTKILEELKRYQEAILSAEKVIALGKKTNKTEEVQILEEKVMEWKKQVESGGK